MERNELRTHVDQMTDFLSNLLMLDRYTLRITLSTRALIGSTTPESSAGVEIDHDYRTVHLLVSEDFDTAEELFETVLHEMVHIRMAPLDHYARILHETVKKNQRKILQQVYSTADENVTVSFTNVLYKYAWEGYKDAYRLDDRGQVATAQPAKKKGNPSA